MLAVPAVPEMSCEYDFAHRDLISYTYIYFKGFVWDSGTSLQEHVAAS